MGCDDERRYLTEVADLDESLRALGTYVLFDQAIPVTTDAALIAGVRNLVEPVALGDFGNGVLWQALETHGYFSSIPGKPDRSKLRDAFHNMLNLYLTNERSANLSMAVNFVTKVLCWLVDYGRVFGRESTYNPKIMYWGSPKVHEIYFLILMSLTGCDILVLNPSFNDNFAKVDRGNEFCLLMKQNREILMGAFPRKPTAEKITPRREPQRIDPADLVRRTPAGTGSGIELAARTSARTDAPVGAFTRTDAPAGRSAGTETARGERSGGHTPRTQSEGLCSDLILVAKLVKPGDIFADILVPLNQRSGYAGEPYPILPTYFTRYIGVPDSSDDWETEYYNRLFNLDQTLQASGPYLRFSGGIPAPDAAESAAIPSRIISYSYQDSLDVLQHILAAKLLPQTQVELLDNTLTKVLVDTVNLLAEQSPHVNMSILLNFSLKLVAWLNRYLPQLFATQSNRSGRTGREGLADGRNPKILFYGNIKPHEIYLLNALHNLGCDVLFVHPQPEGDKPFQLLDKENALTTLVLNEHNLSPAPFPQTERLVRRSTVAYNASKEIEEVIYSEDVGLYKPWQFEGYLTQPITLKTTFDELKILWREPAKVRPEFKVQNQKVYVPNLFAKINGVSANMADYWQDLKTLVLAPQARLIETVPFSRLSYTKQELFQAAYFLNEQGLFDPIKVMKCPHYKFGYLKEPLQHFLVEKINELILAGRFLAPIDEKFKLKILMTILTMEDSLIKLIEVFDYPQEIPKLILYDNRRESFSEDDAILMAYLNLIGLDMVIFTPTNYATIEQYLKPTLFDIHQLPLVEFDLSLPALSSIPVPSANKQGLLSRFLNFRS